MRYALWAAAAWVLLGSLVNFSTLMKLAAHPDAHSRPVSRTTLAWSSLVGVVAGTAVVLLLVFAGLDL